MKKYILIVLLGFLVACSADIELKVDQLKETEEVAKLVDAKSVRVAKLNNSLITVVIDGRAPLNMSIDERGILARKIVEVCLEAAKDAPGILILFTNKDEAGSGSFHYNWSMKEAKFVDVIKSS